MEKMKKEYIEAINREMKNTNDIELLDLIFQLLVKSRVKAEGETK